MPVRRPTPLTGLALLFLAATACMTWHRASAPAPSVLSQRPKIVKIVRSDNMTVEIRHPQLVGDSIIGSVGKPASGHSEAARAAVAVADVKQLAVRGLSAGRTIGLVAGVGATALLVAAAAASDPVPVGGGSGGGGSGGGGSGCGTGCIASCPFVYSWDGHTWRLDSGTFGGAILPALARTDVDNLDFAVAQGDSLRLRVTNELHETDHIDALRVLAVDHDPGVSVAPGPDGALHSVGALRAPIAARDFAGRDVGARVARPDGWSWESTPTIRDTASESRDGIVLTFRREGGSTSARLVLDAHNTPWGAHLMRAFVEAHGRETAAWYDSVTADPRLARQTGAAIAREAFLAVSVWAGGRWAPQGMAWEAGPEVAKRQVVPLDLDRVTGDTVRVRLESAPGLWLVDAAALDFSSEGPLEVHEMAVSSAVDRTGADVRALIEKADGREYVSVLGDAADLTFAVPRTRPGRARSYLLQSTGWYRIHTGETGEPDRVTLARVGREPGVISRVATARLNAAIRAAGAPQ